MRFEYFKMPVKNEADEIAEATARFEQETMKKVKEFMREEALFEGVPAQDVEAEVERRLADQVLVDNAKTRLTIKNAKSVSA